MANESVTEAAPREFFSFNGSYLIHPKTDAYDLMNDVSCWLDAAKEIVNEVAMELTNEGSQMQANPVTAGKMLWGAYHLLQMIDGAVDKVNSSGAKEQRSKTATALPGVAP